MLGKSSKHILLNGGLMVMNPVVTNQKSTPNTIMEQREVNPVDIPLYGLVNRDPGSL